MKWVRRWLVLIIVAELLGGSFLIARRLLRVTPPEADWSLVDPATADDIRTAAATCESAEDWRKLGEIYMAAGFFADSEMCHRVACDLEPQNARFRRQWGFALERLGLLDAANAQYQRTMDLSGTEADACRYFIAKNLLRKDDSEAAQKIFAEGQALPANLYELARLQLKGGELARASTSLAKLAVQGSELLQVNLLGYRLAMERGDARKAFVFADRARYSLQKLQNPFDKEVERIITVTQGLGPGKSWKRGRKLIDSTELEEAQSLLEGEATKDRSAMVLELLAEIALRQRRFDDAVELLEELQAQHGPFPRITAQIGDVLAASQSDNARDYWLKAAQLQAGVDLKAIHHKLADSFTTSGDEDAARRHRALGHYFVGRELLHFGYADKSINYFAGAVELDPTLDQAWFYLGESKRLSGQADEAREAYRKCLERNPHHGRALANLASLESR